MQATVPAVTVLIPVYNAGPLLRDAVDSILAQTFTDFECLVIDDGSTDGSMQALVSIDDPRLRILRNPKNLGLIATLNRGLELARAPLLARMDQDDIALPLRLERQVASFAANPQLALLGTWAQFIDDAGTRSTICRKPADHRSITEQILRGNTFIHPSIMMRTAVARELGGYPLEAVHAEDYALWLRIVERHESANLPECLLLYRIHRGQVSQRKMAAQWQMAKKLSIQARPSFVARGLIAEGDAQQIETLWDRLRGRPGTLGAEFLQMAIFHLRMGKPTDAARIAFSGLQFAPLSLELYSILLPQRLKPWYWWRQLRNLNGD